MHKPQLPRIFPHHHLETWTDEQWLTIPATNVPTTTLIPSQEAVSLEALARLLNGGQPEGGDGPNGRAIHWQGNLYLYDGHTRWIIALLTQQPMFPVRIVTTCLTSINPDGNLVVDQ